MGLQSAASQLRHVALSQLQLLSWLFAKKCWRPMSYVVALGFIFMKWSMLLLNLNKMGFVFCSVVAFMDVYCGLIVFVSLNL